MLREFFLLAVCMLFIALSHLSESAIAVKPEGKKQFSAMTAHPHIERIASEVHPIGSEANHRVRDYIVEQFKQLGLEVRLEKGYSTRMRGEAQGLLAYTENIIAVRRGNGGAKKVYVAGHYDSVFQGPGAADDAYSVASMLEVARLLQKAELKNDIVFLVTDGEEGGLNGARYHQQHNTMEDVGVLLNYEARGNAGPGIAFEWSDDNAWLVREMEKVAVRPIANSLSYEVYKRMWNSTDVTEFKKRGVPFINYAFIDGFSYYHNPADKAENISKASVQHTGENMYRLVRHFANYDFGKIEEGNAVFFNFYGWLVRYPAGVDLGLLVVLILLSFACILRLLQANNNNIPKTLLAVFLQILILAIAMGSAYALAQLVTTIYPEYSLFYAYQYYNYKWYLFAALGLATLFVYILSSPLIGRLGREAFAGGLLLLFIVLTISLYIGMPTGTYVTLFPALALSLFLLLFRSEGRGASWNRTISGMLVMVIFIGIWTFVTHNLFLAFSLNLLFGPVLMGSIWIMVLMTVFPAMGKKDNYTLPATGVSVFLLAIVIAHFQRTPTPQAPLPSQLFYTYVKDAGQGYWATRDESINSGHGPLIQQATYDTLPEPLPFVRWYRSDDYRLGRLLPTVQIDTLVPEGLVYKIKQPERAMRHVVTLPEVSGVDSLLINDFTAKIFKPEQSGRFDLLLLGVGLDSMKIQLSQSNVRASVPFRLSTRFWGLPREVDSPEGVIRRDAFTEVVVPIGQSVN